MSLHFPTSSTHSLLRIPHHPAITFADKCYVRVIFPSLTPILCVFGPTTMIYRPSIPNSLMATIFQLSRITQPSLAVPSTVYQHFNFASIISLLSVNYTSRNVTFVFIHALPIGTYWYHTGMHTRTFSLQPEG
jgi:hypothetical protein